MFKCQADNYEQRVCSKCGQDIPQKKNAKKFCEKPAAWAEFGNGECEPPWFFCEAHKEDGYGTESLIPVSAIRNRKGSWQIKWPNGTWQPPTEETPRECRVSSKLIGLNRRMTDDEAEAAINAFYGPNSPTDAQHDLMRKARLRDYREMRTISAREKRSKKPRLPENRKKKVVGPSEVKA